MSTVAPSVPPPAPLEPVPAGRGCAKNALVGCGIAALVVVLAFVALVFYVQKRPTVLTDFMMKQVEKSYAADVTEAEKQELRAAYASFKTAVEQGKAAREPMERVRVILSPGRTGEITREQVRQLTEAFREAAAGSAGAPTPSPAVETEETPAAPAVTQSR